MRVKTEEMKQPICRKRHQDYYRAYIASLPYNTGGWFRLRYCRFDVRQMSLFSGMIHPVKDKYSGVYKFTGEDLTETWYKIPDQIIFDLEKKKTQSRDPEPRPEQNEQHRENTDWVYRLDFGDRTTEGTQQTKRIVE